MRRFLRHLAVALLVSACLNFVIACALNVFVARDDGDFGITNDKWPCFWVVLHGLGSTEVTWDTLQHGKRLEPGEETIALPALVSWDRNDWPHRVYLFTGWPLLSFQAHLECSDPPERMDERWVGALVLRPSPHRARDSLVLPFQPIYSGFLINSLLFAATLLLCNGGLRGLVRLHRRRRGRCTTCGHDCHRLQLCPECGRPTRSRVA